MPSHSPSIHRRKPSCSDSVSSTSSSSTVTSFSSSRRHSGEVEFDPLSLHPTHHAPPRLSERPFIHSDQDPERPRTHPTDFPTSQPSSGELALPPVASPTPQQHHQLTNAARTEPPDYFNMKLKLLDRPTLLRSHWSASTVQTAADDSTPHEEEDDDDNDEPTPVPQPERLARTTRWQNFSYKRETVPKRPPMKTLDSIENFIKRGGWKRRGIVFQQQEVAVQQMPVERNSSPGFY